MGIFSFRKKATQKIEINNESDLVKALGLEPGANRLAMGKFALECAVSLVAGLVSKCEFRTLREHKPIKGYEYYLWNIRPNSSQNSTQFIQEMISKLCYNNEVLVVENAGELFVCDSFLKQEYAVLETVFYNVTRKDFTFRKQFKASDVIYLKLNNKDLARYVAGIQHGFDQLISEAVERYIKLGGEKIVLNIGALAEADKKFPERIRKYMEEYFKKYFESKNAVIPLYEGFSIDKQTHPESKKADEVAGIVQLKRESMDVAAQALKIPPAILRGDIADVSTLVDNLLTFCIDPLCCQIEEEITSARYTPEDYIKGNYLAIDTTCIKHIDIFSMAANVDKLIACGFYNVDDCREKAGEAPLNTPFSREYVRTKNYASEGGENNEA